MSTIQRRTRYQAAILRGREILLIRHQEHRGGNTYWILPGGGSEEGESEEDCVRREVLEETGLEVHVGRLLFEVALTRPEPVYQLYKTYLCTPLSGEARPGYEPEIDTSTLYGIVEVRWVDLWDEADWDDLMRSNSITYTNLRRVRQALKPG